MRIACAARANGVWAKLSKAGREELVGVRVQLLNAIWSDEYMPGYFNLSARCTIHKKRDIAE